MIKKILLGLTLFASFELQAGESSIESKVTPNWTGFYVGGDLGAIWGQFNGSVADAPFFDRDGLYFPSYAHPYNVRQNSLLGGAQVGYLNQINAFVYGTEISIYGLNFKDTHTLQASDIVAFIDVFKPGDTFSSQMNWQAAWVGRVGSQAQSWLFYGLGGIAVMNPKISTTIPSFLDDEGNLFPVVEGHGTKTLVGGTIGLGSERVLWSNFRVGLEYRYSNFGTHRYNFGQNPVSASPAGFIYTALSADKKLITNLAVVRLNYFFNG